MSAHPQPLTIGVRGSGAGKDAAADYLCAALEARGLKPRRERFATPLRECIEVVTGVPVAVSETAEGKRREIPGWGMTVGRMLQRLGTDAVRERFHNDAWVLALFRRFGPRELVVISDVRFPNEEKAIRERGGVVLNIVRGGPAAVGATAEALAGRDPDHSSERALDEVPADHTIGNSGTLDDLRTAVNELVWMLYGTPA